MRFWAALVLWFAAADVVRAQSADSLASIYVEAVTSVNEEHAKKPGTTTEVQLEKKLPRAATTAFDALLKREGADVPAALNRAAEAALDLDRVEDFDKARTRLGQIAPEAAKALGIAVSRPRALLRGLDGVEPEGLIAVADVLDEVLDAYQAVFGFAELSKVPGKKLRLRVHLVEKIDRPPHFAPQYPFHSEIDFPVVDARGFSSPTGAGQFLLYGLAHELGHVVAMWGKSSNEEQDHHAWAHYTGVVIVSWLAEKRSDAPALANAKDVRWRSVELERERLAGRESGRPAASGAAKPVEPGLESRDAVLATLFALHDLVGPRAIGEAINALDARDERLRVNRVRYYTFSAMGTALRALPGAKKKMRELDALLPR